MEEPSRIGLTATAGAMLEELLEHLNPQQGEEGTRLIKFDLYRLAVALGIKNEVLPPQLEDKSINSLRVNELDEEGVLHAALENSGIVPQGVPIYSFMELLAEYGVRGFYSSYQQTGELPWEQYFN